MTEVNERRTWFSDAACSASVALLGTVNLFKADSFQALMPLDLTLLAAIVCATLTIGAVLRRGFPPGTPVIAIGFASFLPGWLFASDNPYARTKPIELFTLSLLCVAGAAVLVNSRERLWWLLTWVVVIAVGVSAWLRAEGAQSVAGRALVESLNPIGLGRLCAAGAVVLVIATLSARGVRRLLAAGGALFCAAAAVSTGSRGPALAAVLAVAASAVMADRAPGWQRRSLALLAVLAASCYVVVTFWSSELLDRITQSSDVQREMLYGESLWIALTHPEGVGWGDLADHLSVPAMIMEQGYVQYSHNVMLEAAAEGGWLALIGLVMMLVSSHRRLYAQSGSAVWQTGMALWMYSLAIAMTSSDLIGNRLTLVMVGVGLAFPLRRRVASDHPRLSERLS